jgi:plasmid stabilization system protein ParE
MARTIEIHDEAKRELDAAAAVIAGDHPRAASEFLDAVRRDLEIVRVHPEAGKRLGRTRLRQFVVAGWRHSIIYAVEDSIIVVFAFAHHSRRPRYWRDRVRR